MKITGIRSVFSGECHYLIIETDEGITGLGEATLHTRQLAVDGVFKHLEPVLIGQDPMRIEHIWQDIFRCTFWRGGPVLMAALSAIDLALWDIKGKALNTPVYNLLGGKCRDKLRVYIGIGGKSSEELAEKGIEMKEKGYTALRFCPTDQGYGEEMGVMDILSGVRKSVKYTQALREAVGDDIDLVLECHTRMTPPTAVELCNEVAPLHPMFVEDPLRADSPEAFRNLRAHTAVPLGTGEKFGAKWDYKCLIEEELIDYVRTDICNCGGITEMKKIAAYAEAHYMEMVPHGVHHAGFIGLMHVDFATPNFCLQEDWMSSSHPEWLDYDVTFKDGYLTMGDRPGLGVTLLEDKCKPFRMREHPHWRRPDGTVQDW